MTATVVGVEIRDLALDQIRPGNNDRKTFATANLEELAASIAANGLAQPITVRPAGGSFEIVAGERRYRACTLLGWSTIPAIVRELDDEAASAIMLIENLQRADLSPIEEAWAYRDRLDRFGGTLDDLAASVGVSSSHVKRRLDLLELRPEILHLVGCGQLGVSFAWRMARLDSNRQWIALQAYQADPRMGGERFTDLCAQLHLEQSQESMFADDFALSAETFSIDGDRRPQRFTRSALLATIRGLVDLVDDEAARAVCVARRALEVERLRDAS